jgi:hypothetical protein
MIMIYGHGVIPAISPVGEIDDMTLILVNRICPVLQCLR